MMQLISFDDYYAQTERLGEQLSLTVETVAVHRFPDGEHKLTLPAVTANTWVIVRSLDHPNEKLIDLLLVIKSAREQGVERIILVAPYLCYMRQDRSFHPGEVISQQVISEFLDDLVDELITVDPHLHRVHDLQTLFQHAHTHVLHADELLLDYLANKQYDLLLGPDEESMQWVQRLAQGMTLTPQYGAAEKVRLADHAVTIQLPEIPVEGMHVLLVDDMISTGHTLASISELLNQRGALSIDVVTTHALMDDKADELLKTAAIREVISTDSVAHSSNQIFLAPLLAKKIQSLNPA